jgi:hypothetical protein
LGAVPALEKVVDGRRWAPFIPITAWSNIHWIDSGVPLIHGDTLATLHSKSKKTEFGIFNLATNPQLETHCTLKDSPWNWRALLMRWGLLRLQHLHYCGGRWRRLPGRHPPSFQERRRLPLPRFGSSPPSEAWGSLAMVVAETASLGVAGNGRQENPLLRWDRLGGKGWIETSIFYAVGSASCTLPFLWGMLFSQAWTEHPARRPFVDEEWWGGARTACVVRKGHTGFSLQLF